MGSKSSKGLKFLKNCNADAGFSEEEAKQIFSIYDKNNDNVLDQAEATEFFTDYLRAKGVKGKEDKVKKLFAKFDIAGDGCISWEELIELERPGMERYKSTEEKRAIQRQKTREEKRDEPAPASDAKTEAKTEAKAEAKAEAKIEIQAPTGKNLTSLESSFAYFNSLIDWEGEEPDATLLFGEGLQSFMDEIGIKGAASMMVMYKLNNLVTGEMSRDLFLKYYRSVGCSNFGDVTRNTLQFTNAITNNQRQYQQFYEWCFDYLLDSDNGVKVLEMDMANEAWEHVLGPDDNPHWALYAVWKEFMAKEVEEENRAYITRDEWNMLWEMKRELRVDLSNAEDCDEDGCWPTMCDNFIEFATSR